MSRILQLAAFAVVAALAWTLLGGRIENIEDESLETIQSSSAEIPETGAPGELPLETRIAGELSQEESEFALTIQVIDSVSMRKISTAEVSLLDGLDELHELAPVATGEWAIQDEFKWSGSTVNVESNGYISTTIDLGDNRQAQLLVSLKPQATFVGSVKSIDSSGLESPLFVVAWNSNRDLSWEDLNLDSIPSDISVAEIDLDGSFEVSVPPGNGPFDLAAVGPGVISETPIRAIAEQHNELTVQPVFVLRLNWKDLSNRQLAVNPGLFRTFNHTTWRTKEKTLPYRAPSPILRLAGLRQDPDALE